MKNKVLIIVVVFLLIVWGTLGYFAYRYAEVLKQHPCSVCAAKIGNDVVCTTTGKVRTYFLNGSFEDVFTRVNVRDLDINITLLKESFGK